MTLTEAIQQLKMAVPMRAVTMSEFNDFIEAVNMAIDALENLPSAQQRMTATSNTIVSDTVKIPVMDGTNERLPSAQPEHLVKESGDLVKDLANDCITEVFTAEEFDEMYVDDSIYWTVWEEEDGREHTHN